MPLDQARWQIELTAADKTAAAFNSATARMRALDQAGKAMTTGVGGGFTSLMGVVARFAPALTAAALAYKVFSAGMKAGDLGEQAEQLNLTTDELQAFRAAAVQAGVSTEQLDTGMMRFTKAMGTANDGNDEMIARFDKLGVKLRDTAGNLRKPADVLPELSTGLLKLSSDTERNALMMEFFGRSGSKNVTMLKAWADGTENLTSAARDQGLLVSTATIKAWDDLGDSLKKSGAHTNALLATLTAPGAVAANDLMKKLADNTLRAAKALNELPNDASFFQKLDAIFGGRYGSDKMGGLSMATPAEMALIRQQDEEKNLAALRKELADPANAGSEAQINAAIEATKQNVDALEASYRALAREASNAIDRQRLFGGEGASPKNGTRPGVSQPAGNKDKGFAESAEKKLIELRAEHAAIDKALASYATVGTESVAELDKRLAAQIALEKRIAELTVNLSEKDPLVDKLKIQATAISEGNLKKAEMNRLLTEAEGISKQYGDGTRELARATDELNKMQAAGLITADQYAFALKRTKEGAADQERASRGAKDGITGYVAGLEQGFADLDRANTSFEIGKKSIQMFDEAIAQLASGAEVNFAKILQSFLVMIVQMEARAALSSLWKLASSGGGIAGLFGNLFGGGGANPAAMNYGGGSAEFGYFADGGDYRAGMPRVVGENGPEFDIPRTAGTIVSQRDIAAAMNGGGGDSTVIVNQTMYFGSDVTQSTLRDWAIKTKNETIAAVIDGRRRGGSMKQAFA